MASLSSIIERVRNLKRIARLVDLIAEDIEDVRGDPAVKAALDTALRSSPELKPVRAILRNAGELADLLDDITD